MTRIAVLVAGFAPRSLRYTHTAIIKRLVRPLQNAGLVVDVYVYSFTSSHSRVLSVERGDSPDAVLDMSDTYLIPGARVQVDEQEQLDHLHPNIDFVESAYGAPTALNCMRQIYQEYRAVEMIRGKSYDGCVLSRPCNLPLVDVEVQEVLGAIADPDRIYTAPFNRCWGTMDGYYAGSYSAVSAICERYLHLVQDADVARSRLTDDPWKPGRAELLLRIAIERRGLSDLDSTMRFERIRAGGIPKGYPRVPSCRAFFSKENILELASLTGSDGLIRLDQ